VDSAYGAPDTGSLSDEGRHEEADNGHAHDRCDGGREGHREASEEATSLQWWLHANLSLRVETNGLGTPSTRSPEVESEHGQGGAEGVTTDSRVNGRRAGRSLQSGCDRGTTGGRTARRYGVGGGTIVDWIRPSTARRSSSHLAGVCANTSGAIQRVLQLMPVPEASGLMAIFTWMRHAATVVTFSVGLGYRSPVRFP